MRIIGIAILFALAVAPGVAPIYAQRGAGPGGPANPFAGNQQAIEEGRETYNRVCTACHGADGTAGDRAPALAAPGRRYIRQNDRDLFDAVSKGIPGTAMPSLGLNDTESWKVAAYLRGLRGTAIDTPSKGNVAHGEQVFLTKGECIKCHMLRGKGGLIGPDLSNIAGQRKLSSIRDALTKPTHHVYGDGGQIESILYPLTSYKAVKVTTRDGKTIRGVVRNEDSFSLQVMGMDNALHLFTRVELKEVVDEPGLMPTDFDKRLSAEEFQDLMAFLSRQGVPAPPAAGPGRGRGAE